MKATEKVKLALEELTKEDVRDPAWRGCFGVPAIAVKCVRLFTERLAYPGTPADDYRLAEHALAKLENEGIVTRCPNDLWRLT